MKTSKSYSYTDRLIHKAAFNSSILHDVMSDIEYALYFKKWKNIVVDRPVFITSLPRAGTTIILECLSKLPGMASHIYRDMPFVLTPVIWKKVAGKFYSNNKQKERAHGDGLMVNEDSPEAFEEIIWKKFFPQKYSQDRLLLCDRKDVNSEFKNYLTDHIRKILYIRSDDANASKRYISKNNGNIAHIECIREIFPDAYIVIPVRNPIEHAISMLRQHNNFIKQHAVDSFTYDYMNDLGHFEFGALHKPIAFEGVDDLIEKYDPVSINYWLKYWIISFKYLIKLQGVNFISYEGVCSGGIDSIAKLCRHLGIKASSDEIASASEILHPAPTPRNGEYDISQDLIDNASDIYKHILNVSLK